MGDSAFFFDFGSTFHASWLHFGFPGLEFQSIFVAFWVFWSVVLLADPFGLLQVFCICSTPETFLRDWLLVVLLLETLLRAEFEIS